MIKKLTAAAITLSMVLSFAVMPAHAASFSAANKRHNVYDLAKSSDSNFTSLASDYGGEYLQANTITFDYDHTNENVDSTFSDIFYTKNRAKFKGSTTSSKDGLIKYKWTNGIMGRAADGSKVAADIPVFVHQRIYFAWYAGRGESLEFRPYYNTSEGSTTGFKLFKEDGGYIQNMNSKSAFSMVKYNESGFDLTTSSSTSNPVFNTFDFIFDYSNGHEFAWFFFINGKLVGISKPTSNKPDMFYGWTLRSPDTINRQNDYVTIYGDEANGWGHTEYIQANGYYPTLEDVMQDKGLMTESVSDSKIMMKTTDLAGYMPPASANAKVNDVQINEDVTYSGTAATISHTQSNTDEEEIAAHMLQGVIPPDKSGVSYASYHPRAKYVKISFDQTIGAGTIAYKLCYNTNRTAALSFWKDNGYLYASVKGGGGNNYLNGAGGRTTAGENATNHIDWILEFHENEQDTSEGGIIHYLYCNGDFVAQGKVGNHSNTRLADITVETKGSSSPEVTIDNWSMTLYNQEAVFNDIGMGSPSQGEIPAPKHENVKVIFTENFEGKTAESLASTYPRTTRISDGTCLSYWGNWGSALATGYNSVNGIFACAGVASNNSRTCEIYVPADKRPQRGLANIKFNIKPQASLSRQNVILFRTDSYAASDDGKNGVQILENGDLTPYTGSWLEVNVWVDLDNDTYLYNVYNTGNGNVVKRGSGTQKFNNLGGFVIKLKGSDSGKDFSEVAPVIDNIYFASAEIPDNNAFNLKTFSFADGDADINLAVGDNVTEYTDVYMMLYSGTDNRLKNVVKQPVTFNSNTKTASVSVDDSNAASGDIYRLFVWDKDTLKPIFSSIDSDKKVYPNTINDNADFHSSTMRAFLADSNANCGNYADGTVAAEEPMPITFLWAGEEGCSYVLKVSENSNMSAPWAFETEDISYDVYNLKVGTRYYWTVDAVKNNRTLYTTDVQTFTTVDAAPRNLLIGGSIRNARDIGGWRTTNGKRVKQGLVFRTSALDIWDNDMDRLNLCVSPGGIDTMKNLLGIKTEIDLRQDHSHEENFPDGKSTSILGAGVTYYHYSMVAEDFLTQAAAIRNVFAVFANANNYPITYHCAVGADRTGFITYLLNGLLGVSKENLTRDYLLTNFSYQSKFREPISGSYVATLDGYTGATLQEKIYNYLATEIGVPTANLDFIINYLTE